MKVSKVNVHRRDFLKAGSVAVGSIAMFSGSALAADTRLEETDSTAQALGYKHDAANVDKAKFPNYKGGETCANCQLYQAKADAPWGPCPLFAGKDVSAKGWCSAYSRKA